MKRLQQKIDVYLERDIIHVPSSSYKIVKKEDEDIKVKIIEDFDDLKKMLDDDSISGDVKCFFLNESSCFSLWRELYVQMKYEASFKMFNDKLDFSMLRISNINGKNIQVYTYEEDGVFFQKDFGSEERFSNYLIKKKFVLDQLLTSTIRAVILLKFNPC